MGPDNNPQYVNKLNKINMKCIKSKTNK